MISSDFNLRYLARLQFLNEFILDCYGSAVKISEGRLIEEERKIFLKDHNLFSLRGNYDEL